MKKIAIVVLLLVLTGCSIEKVPVGNEAKALALRGQALKDNPGLVQLNAIEKWDGHLPNVNGGAIPFISVK